MTVQTDTARAQYSTNGTTGPWTVPFYFLADDHLSVIYTTSAGVETTLVLDTDYAVFGSGDEDGGTVTLTTAYAAGGYITILRNVPFTQELEYVETDRFPASAHQRGLDKLTMLCQRVFELVSRALVFSPSDTGSTQLPAAAARAGRVIAFDAEGEMTLNVPADGTASSLATQLASAATIIQGAGMVGYDPRRAWADGTIGLRLNEVISIGAYMEVGMTASEAFTAAVARALALITSSSGFQFFGVGIYVPGNRNYDLNALASAIQIPKHGIAFYSDPGRGARIIRNGTIFDVGDYTNTIRVTQFALYDITLDAGVTNSSAIAIKCYRTQEARFFNVKTVGFDIHYDLYGASTTRLLAFRTSNSNRTANATAFVRMQGLDLTPAEAYAPGGGCHVIDFELKHDSSTYYTGAAFLVHTVDGLYITQGHATGCARGISLIPEANPANHTITDVYATQFYWDNPPPNAPSADMGLLYAGGSVGVDIVMADSTLTNSVYQNVWLLQCYGRGSDEPDNIVEVEILDTGGLFYADGRRAQDFKLIGGTYRQARQSAVRVRGASSGDYLEIDGFYIGAGANFRDNNSTSTSNIGSAVSAEVSTGTISGNAFGADAGTTDYIVQLLLKNTGSADDAGACIVNDNDFSNATATISDVFTSAQAGAKVMIADNLPSGPGQHIRQSYPVRTTNNTPKIAWSWLVLEGQNGMVETKTAGSAVEGTLGAERANYRYRTNVYRQGGGGSATLQGFSTVTAYDNITTNNAPVLLSLLTGTAWVGGAAVAALDMITSGGNVYLVEVAGNLHATNPPVHTSGVATNGTASLGFVSATAPNTLALINAGAPTTDMSWTNEVEADFVP